ncbi:flavin reductase family protein [Shouchella clausii]|uniref:Flavin reductase like domain-containing protein n=1 Tax=Shouchella clausii TaxID=79880 RepID=A0A268RZS0_SHOCL|nr:flavin reductase family protein [Shouchella clausii]PAD41718.1 hypothetical protein CHH54_15880 [Bacillus sp. 7520-S]MBU8595864.1 flavin reductase family protein [Shouchella clausii]MCY1106092.1 flavin reductase family protein [Shouchella clausii]MEB5478740.1 flavin reductase family protein [Shouchella clausii]MED4158405.1 flavin reductase family protein [Shouchella clausii]
MRLLRMDELSARDRYRWMSGAIVPRPIALVTTLTEKGGVVNAAPFSFFTMLASDPPLLSIAVGRREGQMKDTARNAVAMEEMVIHVVSEKIVADMNETAATLAPDESELERTSFHLTESVTVSVPAIKEARIRFECKLESHLPTKNDAGELSFDLLIARVLAMHIAEDVVDQEANGVDMDALQPVARLAGPNYAGLGSRYSLKRPK